MCLLQHNGFHSEEIWQQHKLVAHTSKNIDTSEELVTLHAKLSDAVYCYWSCL